MMKKVFFTFKNFILIVLIVLFGVSSYYFITLGINDHVMKSTSYKTGSSIDYKVYLKENSFFEEKFLTKNSEQKIIISSLIDYINVTFNYNLFFDNYVSGNYTYYVTATISADKESGTNKDSYWSKSYTLVEPTVVEYDNSNGFNFLTDVKINYQEYNSILKEFKSTYGLTADGNLKVVLVVESNNTSDVLGKVIQVTSNSTSFSIPLTQQTLDVEISEESENNSDTITEKVKLMDNLHMLFFIIGIALGMVSLLFLYVFISVIIAKIKSISEYDKKLSKILSTYDSIIVNVSTLPDYKDYDVIKVKEFSELIDAHSEVRRPINYIKTASKESTFILVSENIVWEYVLKDESKKR